MVRTTKKHYRGCYTAIRPMQAYAYPKGHPCYGCPYIFEANKPSCIMNGEPDNCVWYFYRRLINKHKPDADSNCAEHKAIGNCINKLLRVAERKYGKKYAGQLKNRRLM